jgi:hypothetical protein
MYVAGISIKPDMAGISGYSVLHMSPLPLVLGMGLIIIAAGFHHLFKQNFGKEQQTV